MTFHLNAQSSFETVFDQKFTTSQFQEDFAILQEGLETLHTGLYRYIAIISLLAIFSVLGRNENLREKIRPAKSQNQL